MAFDVKGKLIWRKQVWRIFQQAGFKAPEICAALVMCAVALVGTDPTTLSELTGMSAAYATRVLRRLRKQRLLIGQTLRIGWADDTSGDMAAYLDAGVAAGLFSRFPDAKRSAGQKARKPETRATGPRRKRTIVPSGTVFTPKQQRSDPLYGLPEWETKPQTKAEGR